MRHVFAVLIVTTISAAASIGSCGVSRQVESQDTIDQLVATAVESRKFPAAAIAVGSAREIAKTAGYGSYTYRDATPVTDSTLFDLASLTKVVATTTALMILTDRGQISLEDPVALHVPEFAHNGKAGVTIRHLLQHQGGLVPFRRFYLRTEAERTRTSIINSVLRDSLAFAPGSETRYSDLGFMTLGVLVERVSGTDLASFTTENIFRPLAMSSTGFLAAGRSPGDVVPTEVDTTYRDGLVQGVVHDENAHAMGGVAGHAGLFSTARDLARFAQMLAAGGTVDGHRFVSSETFAAFTNRDNFQTEHRGLGWDFKSLEGYSSAGARFGPKSFGHTGFTGTSLWVDPEARVFAVLLTNRVYPTRQNRGHIEVRPAFADAAYDFVR